MRGHPKNVLSRMMVASIVIGAVILELGGATIITPGRASAAPNRHPHIIGVTAHRVPIDLTALDNFERAAAKRVRLVSYYRSFAYSGFESALADRVLARGAVPMITWEPWDPAGGVFQPDYSLASIIAGDHDAYVRSFAKDVAGWGRPLMLRFAHEMNGTWYPWAARVNGNTAAQYVDAWRRVRRIFRAEGAHNVSWIWSPNVVMNGSVPLRRLYPGNRHVDWVGIDCYNWGTARPESEWRSFEQLCGPTLRRVRHLTNKPIMLAEVGSGEAGGSKAAWISGMFRSLRRNPDIRALVWFNHRKETDWRIQSSRRARVAFAEGAASFR